MNTLKSEYAGKTIYFKVPVDCAHPHDNKEEVYEDTGLIMFPDDYSETGAATRLVIYCHGAGGSIQTNDPFIETTVLARYLVANGYAVMDVNGLPEEYCSKYGVDSRNNIGSYVAMRALEAGYRYCIERFNLKKEIFVFGASMGGISSSNFVLSTAIPIIAHSAYCPVLDTYNQIFLHPWTNGLPKTALGVFYRFNKDENGGYIYDEKKVLGLNPAKNKKALEDYPVPLKFWQCLDDEVVACDVTQKYVEEIKKSGRIVEFTTFENGGHEPQDAGNFVENPCGNTIFRGEKIKPKTADEEAFLWIKRFDF